MSVIVVCVRETGVSVDFKFAVHDSNTTDHTLTGTHHPINMTYLLLVQEETSHPIDACAPLPTYLSCVVRAC